MNDEEFIEHVQTQCTEAFLDGCITHLMRYETSKKYMEKHAGKWELRTNVNTLERLLELAKKGLK